MTNTLVRVSAVILSVAVGSCASPTVPPIDAKKFDGLYRAAKTTEAAINMGINHEKFGDAIRAFATELSIATDKAGTDKERELVRLYSETLTAYRDSDEMWRLKIDSAIEKPVKSADDFDRKRLKLDTQFTNLIQFGDALGEAAAKDRRVPVEARHEGLLTRYSVPTEEMTNQVMRKYLGMPPAKGTDLRRWPVFDMDDALQKILAEAAKRLARANAVYIGAGQAQMEMSALTIGGMGTLPRIARAEL